MQNQNALIIRRGESLNEVSDIGLLAESEQASNWELGQLAAYGTFKELGLNKAGATLLSNPLSYVGSTAINTGQEFPRDEEQDADARLRTRQ